MDPAQAQALIRQGVDALRRQQPQAARTALQAVVDADQADAATYLGLAYAAAMLEDTAAAQAQADLALAHEPLNLRALLLKADLFHVGGDRSAAAACYQATLKAVPANTALPPDLQKDVQRAEAMVAHYEQELQRSLERTLEHAAAPGGGASARFMQSVDLLLGRRQLYLQQPKHYFFPELPHIQFHPRERFPWLPALEAATADIRDELLAVLRDDPGLFTPYVQRDSTRPSLSTGGMLDNADWSAFYLWKTGTEVTAHAQRCPRTLAALAQVPLSTVPGRSPSILFSLLRPGAHIPAHHGIVNTRLICHLPLIVPPGCTFRVGNETREWVEGQAWVFDDTIEHEAWNRSDQPRVILLFEVWQPELTADERQSVQALFQALDGQAGGAGTSWSI